MIKKTDPAEQFLYFFFHRKQLLQRLKTITVHYLSISVYITIIVFPGDARKEYFNFQFYSRLRKIVHETCNLTTSSIAHLKSIPAWKLSFEKCLPEIQYQNNEITNKNYKLSWRNISEWNNTNAIKSIANPVLMHLNIFSFCCLWYKQIKRYSTPV